MDDIRVYQSNIFILNYISDMISENDIKYLEKEIFNIANFFGFNMLPKEYKIEIFIDKEIFWSHLNDNAIAITLYANKVHVLDSKISNIDQFDFLKIIVHECTHVLQGYCTCILPSHYIWLYESIACYLAKQSYNKLYYDNNITWNDFVVNFKKYKTNYQIAYFLGKKLFEKNTTTKVLEILHHPEEYGLYFENLFYSIFD